MFSDQVNDLCRKLPKDIVNTEIISQLCRAGASPAANYIEAIESLSKKDFIFGSGFVGKKAKKQVFG